MTRLTLCDQVRVVLTNMLFDVEKSTRVFSDQRGTSQGSQTVTRARDVANRNPGPSFRGHFPFFVSSRLQVAALQ